MWLIFIFNFFDISGMHFFCDTIIISRLHKVHGCMLLIIQGNYIGTIHMWLYLSIILQSVSKTVLAWNVPNMPFCLLHIISITLLYSRQILVCVITKTQLLIWNETLIIRFHFIVFSRAVMPNIFTIDIDIAIKFILRNLLLRLVLHHRSIHFIGSL